MKGKPRTLKESAYWAATILILAALIAGCGSVTPTLAPTQDIQPTLDLVKTEAAQTVIAEMTQNAPTATPVVLTDTPAAEEVTAPTATTAPTSPPAPTATVAVVLPTATNTRVPATLAPAATATLSTLNCTIDEQSVAFGDDFPPNADFDGRWVVENTGSDTWSATAVDFRYVSGTKFQTKIDAFDLPANVAPDGEITLVVDMRAPSTPGRYSTTWALIQGGTTICVLPITLDVVD